MFKKWYASTTSYFLLDNYRTYVLIFKQEVFMARRSLFPDPNDRSPNSPSIIASKPTVIGLYNQAHPTEKAERVVESVKTWFIEQAKNAYKWDTATFHGSECVLEVKLEKRKIPQG